MEASGPRVGPSGGVQSGGPWELKEVGVCGQSGSFLIQPSLMASHASGSFLPVLDLHLGSGHVSEESNPVAQQGAQITTCQIGLSSSCQCCLLPSACQTVLSSFLQGYPPGLVELYPGLSLTPHRRDMGYLWLFPTLVPHFLSSCLPRGPAWNVNSPLAWGSTPP